MLPAHQCALLGLRIRIARISCHLNDLPCLYHTTDDPHLLCLAELGAMQALCKGSSSASLSPSFTLVIGEPLTMAAVSFSERTRTYQQEMFDRSMEGNRIIVVGCVQATLFFEYMFISVCQMDTGSGKTQVYVEADTFTDLAVDDRGRALLRIQAELDRCAEEKVRDELFFCVAVY